MIKLKNELIYILSFIFSLYTSYLICRLHNANLIGNLCIVFVNILATEYLTYLLNKNIKLNEVREKIKHKTKIIIIFTSIIISIVILLLNFNIFTHKYTGTNITISSENLNSSNIVKSMYVNNVFYNVENNELADQMGNYIYETSIGIEFNVIDEHTLKIDIPKFIDIKLIFNEQEGNITICDGESTSTINTENDTYEYTVKSNSYIDNLFILRTLLSLVSLIYFTGLIILAVIYLDLDRRCELITSIVASIIGWLYFKLYTTGVMFNDSTTYMWGGGGTF